MSWWYVLCACATVNNIMFCMLLIFNNNESLTRSINVNIWTFYIRRKKSETLNTSRLWPMSFSSGSTVMLTTSACCKSAPCLGSNVINFVSLTKSWPGWAGWIWPNLATLGLTPTVYGNDATPGTNSYYCNWYYAILLISLVHVSTELQFYSHIYNEQSQIITNQWDS